MTAFNDKPDLGWCTEALPQPSTYWAERAVERQASLTKPPGSLGRLEQIAAQFAGWQQSDKPDLDFVMVRVFAADHGICAQGVSAFPQQVTRQMVMNFLSGGAAINVLSNQVNADFAVVNLGMVDNHLNIESSGLLQHPVGPGTEDFSQKQAMSETQLAQALGVGRAMVNSHDPGKRPRLFIGGEMGIGNTSSASALCCVLLGMPPEQGVGPGTGLNADGVKSKAATIEAAIKVHHMVIQRGQPLETLQTFGGFEIAALVGAYISAAQQGIPSLIDGFICTAAALVACRLNPAVRSWMLFSHQSAEPAHRQLLSALAANPILDLGLRLGEGSGAVLAVPILQSALQLHNQMATFEEASVAEKLL